MIDVLMVSVIPLAIYKIRYSYLLSTDPAMRNPNESKASMVRHASPLLPFELDSEEEVTFFIILKVTQGPQCNALQYKSNTRQQHT